MIFKVHAACNSNKGRIRGNNEDNYFFNGAFMPYDNPGEDNILSRTDNSAEAPFYGVFDGVGGGNYGEVASWKAASNCAAAIKNCSQLGGDDEFLVSQVNLQLNEAVLEGQREMVTERMASTSVTAFFRDGNVIIGNLGDSRAYLIRGGEMRQLSVDHAEESRINPVNGKVRKGAIYQYLGINTNEILIEPSVSTVPLQDGDFVLLCSDGLTDMVPEAEICRILLAAGSPAEAVRDLTAQALENGGKDNVTILVCQAELMPEAVPAAAPVAAAPVEEATDAKVTNEPEKPEEPVDRMVDLTGEDELIDDRADSSKPVMPESKTNTMKKLIPAIAAVLVLAIIGGIAIGKAMGKKSVEPEEQPTVQEVEAAAVPAEEEVTCSLEEETAAEPEITPEPVQEPKEKIVTVMLEEAQPGDHIIYGRYEQGNTTEEKEDIEWLVLAREEDRLLVLSWHVLDCRAYHDTDEDVTWETSDVRAWLNSEFMDAAFTVKEQELIRKDNVTADKNPDHPEVELGNVTQDHIFLLSSVEATVYFEENYDRLCVPTDYAIAVGDCQFDEIQVEGETPCWWWLRTPGENQRLANFIQTGEIKFDGAPVKHIYGIRPAMWLKLESSPIVG